MDRNDWPQKGARLVVEIVIFLATLITGVAFLWFCLTFAFPELFS